MNLGLTLRHLFPAASPTRDYIVAKQGGEASVIIWKLADPQPTSEELAEAWPAVRLAAGLAKVRLERDRRLRRSDRTQLPDFPLTTPQREQWEAYRDALRNFPETLTDAEWDGESAFDWPQEPA